MSGLSGWLLCLVNLLVFSDISATRCLYCRCEVACTVAARCLYYHNMVLVLSLQGTCTIAARRLVLSLQGGLYYHNMVLVTPLQAA